MVWLLSAVILFVLQAAAILIAEFRRPNKAVAWLCILFIIPVAGFFVYCLIAQEYRQRAKFREMERMAMEDAGRRQERTTRGLPLPGQRNCVEVLTSVPEFYERMLQDIRNARHHIHMVYYIWNDDTVGRRFRDALIGKALEGVEVRIVYDGIGAYTTKDPFWSGLKEAGGQVRCFLPMRLSLWKNQLNYRNHRKLTIVDGAAGFIGGANIGDEYTGTDKELGFWRDTSVRIEGEAVGDLQRTFMSDWLSVSGEILRASDRLFPKPGEPGRDQVQVVPGGPDTEWSPIQTMFFSAFCSAKERIYITSPYFIPDESLMTALRAAAFAGVDVRIIIPGVSDGKLTLWATLSYARDMLASGVRVFRYRKGFMHAKTALVDRHFATVGSANLDIRSLYSNFEINAAFFDAHLVERMAQDFLMDLKDSEEINLDSLDGLGRLHKAKEAFSRMLSPLL